MVSIHSVVRGRSFFRGLRHGRAPYPPQSRSLGRNQKRNRQWLPVIFFIMIAGAMAGCDPIVSIRGNLPNDLSSIDDFKTNVTHKADVRRVLGNPLQESSFDQNTWYYFRQRASRYAFFDPTILEHEVLVLRFGENDVLTEITRLNKDDLNQISLDNRETFVPRQEVSVFRQIIESAGRPVTAPATR